MRAPTTKQLLRENAKLKADNYHIRKENEQLKRVVMRWLRGMK